MSHESEVSASVVWESCRGEVSELSFQFLNDHALLIRLLQSCSRRFDDSCEVSQCKQFEPQGLSVVLMGGETSLVLHTWPELGVATLDVSAKSEFAKALFSECFSVLRAKRTGLCASTG